MGGCFNLVFGISVITLIEIIYALTIRCFHHYKSQKDLEKVVRVQPANAEQKKVIKRRYGSFVN